MLVIMNKCYVFVLDETDNSDDSLSSESDSDSDYVPNSCSSDSDSYEFLASFRGIGGYILISEFCKHYYRHTFCIFFLAEI